MLLKGNQPKRDYHIWLLTSIVVGNLFKSFNIMVIYIILHYKNLTICSLHLTKKIIS